MGGFQLLEVINLKCMRNPYQIYLVLADTGTALVRCDWLVMIAMLIFLNPALQWDAKEALPKVSYPTNYETDRSSPPKGGAHRHSLWVCYVVH